MSDLIALVVLFCLGTIITMSIIAKEEYILILAIIAFVMKIADLFFM